MPLTVFFLQKAGLFHFCLHCCFLCLYVVVLCGIWSVERVWGVVKFEISALVCYFLTKVHILQLLWYGFFVLVWECRNTLFQRHGRTSSVVKINNYKRTFFCAFLRKNFFHESARKNLLPQLKLTIVEEGFSVHSHGRSSSTGMHRRRFFHS